MGEVDFTEDVAKWIVKHGGCKESELTLPTLGKTQGRVALSSAAARDLHNGKTVALLLADLYNRNGHLSPCPVASLHAGTGAEVVLNNWNPLLAELKKSFAIDLTTDEKALLVGGQPAVLEHVIELLRTRCGGGGQGGLASGPTKGLSRVPTGRLKKLTQDFDEDRIASVILFVAQTAGIYAFIMASLLSVFVPQTCPATIRIPEPHACTTHENFFDLSKYNKAVLAVNFVTLGLLVFTQWFFAYREYFCIQAFDFDTTLPSDNLKEEILLYPSFADRLRKMNLASLLLSVGLLFLVATNFIMSCILILRDYSSGKTSVTGLISSCLLIMPRVLNWLLQSHVSYSTGLPISLFTKRPAVPNTIDADFRFNPDVYQPNVGHKDVAPASTANPLHRYVDV